MNKITQTLSPIVIKIVMGLFVVILASSYIAVYKWAGANKDKEYQVALKVANDKIRELEKSHQSDVDEHLLSWQENKLTQEKLNNEKDNQIAALSDDLNYIYWVYNISASDSGLPKNPSKQKITKETSCATVIRDNLRREIEAKHQLSTCIDTLISLPCVE